MRRTITLTAVVMIATVAAIVGQGQGRGRGIGPQVEVPGQGSDAGRRGGQPPAPAAALQIQQVKPGLYAILNPGSNTIAVRVTSEGVLIVDDMFAQHFDQIVGLIKSVTDQPVRYVISTHHHGDHTGGNAQFLKANATVVGHKNARAAMMGGANPQPGPPPITYTTEAAVHLGGAEVQLHHVGRGHTNGDTIVYFPDLRVMATGDLFVVLPNVPTIDYANGGSTLQWVPTIDNILKFEFDTVIPGHGPVATKADLQRFKERVVTLQTRTRELIKKGVTRDQYLAQLKVDDLGWTLNPTTLFVRNSAPGFYDELAKQP